MHDLAVNLAKNGDAVTVLCPPPTFPFGSFNRIWKPATVTHSERFRVVNLWTWQPNSPNLSKLSRMLYYAVMPILAIAWTIMNLDFHVIITSSGTTPLVWLPGLLQKRLFKKPWILDERDLLIDGAINLGFLEKNAFLTLLLRKQELICYQNCDYVLVTSENARRTVLSYGVHENKVLLIPNGAETEIFVPMTCAKKSQIIYTGNIGYAQDFDCVIAAMKEITSHNIHLVIVGEGECKQYVKDLVSANNLGDYVTFTGGLERSKLPSLLSESIAGLAPVKKLDVIQNQISAKIFDYMACGIPFVAVGGSELKQIADCSGAGFALDNDADIIAKTIIHLAKNPELGKEMGRKGRQYCEKFYNRKIMANKIKLLIRTLLNRSENNSN